MHSHSNSPITKENTSPDVRKPLYEVNSMEVVMKMLLQLLVKATQMQKRHVIIWIFRVKTSHTSVDSFGERQWGNLNLPISIDLSILQQEYTQAEEEIASNQIADLKLQNWLQTHSRLL